MSSPHLTRRTFLAAVASAGVVRAQNAQQRGKEIAIKAIQALGGDAFRNMQTRTETGRAYSFYREQLSGLSVARIHTKYLTDGNLPVRQVQRQVFGKKEDDAVIFTTKDVWEITYRGAKPLPEERFKQYQDSTLRDTFYILRMRIDEPNLVFEARGRDVVENQPVEVIEIFDSENRNVTLWLHSSTLLPVKQRFLRWEPTINDRREEVTRWAKYRDIGDGVMWPFQIQRERDTEKIFELFSEEVKAGGDMPQAMFELPPGITILKK